jgi:adenine-specific DNA-methyltransferase
MKVGPQKKKSGRKKIESYEHAGLEDGTRRSHTDYDGRSVYSLQFFFPMAGKDEGWARLGRNLKAEIDPERIEKYRGTVWLPFEEGDHKRVAVKIVDDRGIVSLRILETA